VTGKPKVYIALEGEEGQLVVNGPLSLLDRLVTTLAAQKTELSAKQTPTTEPKPRAEPKEGKHDAAR